MGGLARGTTMPLKIHTAVFLSVMAQMLSLSHGCEIAVVSWLHSQEESGKEQRVKGIMEALVFFSLVNLFLYFISKP